MQQISQDIYNQMVIAMCRPEGTFAFRFTSENLFDKNNDGGIIFEITSKGQYYRLDRDKAFNLNLFHSSPGTGTHLALIDLNTIASSKSVFICFTWSTSNIDLYLGSKEIGENLIHAVGIPASTKFSIGKDGGVYQIGDKGLEVMGINVYKGSEKILTSSAIEAWQETIKATSILETGTSAEGYIYEVVVTNLTLSMLVTGFEIYSKTRFLEIEQEGIIPNIDSLLNKFLTNGERKKGLSDILKQEADAENISLLEYIVNKDRINFQNFQQCKIAYNKAYGLKFGKIEIEQKILERIQQYITFRHKIIHVSPLTAMFFNENPSIKEPIFPKKALAIQAKNDFNCFIEQLHKVTLSLRPNE